MVHLPTITDLEVRFMGAYLIISKSMLVAGIIDDIRRVFNILAEQSRKAEHETGLTGSQHWVIKMLDDTSAIKVTELARRMHIHPATMVGLLDRLEVKGLVQRSRSERTDALFISLLLIKDGNWFEIHRKWHRDF